ncbi:MFS transporter [Clostridium tertium]|uniref:Enterobactin exporter EntS n=1 Tax=Clostridium tertium TaxID=1559 RepID=A0A6N3A7R9_9CLOT
MSIGNVISPAIAALVYGSLGLKGVFIVNSISFFISAISEMFLVIPRNVKDKGKLSLNKFTGEFKDGINFILKKRDIINVVCLAVILNFAFGSFSVGGAYLSKIILNVSDFQYGLVDTFGVVGMIFATFLIGWQSKKRSLGKNLYLSLMISSVVLAGYAIVSSKSIASIENGVFYLYLLLLLITFILCLFIGLANTFLSVGMQSIVPLEFMGRVSTVVSTGAMIASPLSSMVYGYLFDKVSVASIFLISSGVMIIAMLFFKKSLYQIKIDKEIKEENCEIDAELV